MMEAIEKPAKIQERSEALFFQGSHEVGDNQDQGNNRSSCRGRQDSGQKQADIAVCQGRPGIADKEDPHQKEEELVALEILGQGSDQGSGDSINQGKYGNQVAQAAEGGIYFPGNIRQNADDHIFIAAQHEGYENEEKGLNFVTWHEKSPIKYTVN